MMLAFANCTGNIKLNYVAMNFVNICDLAYGLNRLLRFEPQRFA